MKTKMKMKIVMKKKNNIFINLLFIKQNNYLMS